MSFKVFVKTLNGLCITAEVTSSTTVAELKAQVQDKEGIPPEAQSLIFSSKHLNNDKTLEDYGIYHEC